MHVAYSFIIIKKMQGEDKGNFRQCSAMQLFYKEWRMIYKFATLLRQTAGRVEPLDTRSFAERTGFAKRQLGPFVLIANSGYSGKRPTNCLQSAYESRIITAPFDSNAFHFNKINHIQALFGIRLQDRQLAVLDRKENALKEYSHFIVISGAPVCEGHALFVPFLQENHAQVLSRKLMAACVQAYQLLPQFKFSYNSQGAGSSVNHFHIQIIDPRQLCSSGQFAFQATKGEEMKGEALEELGIGVQQFTWMSACYLRFTASSTIFKQAGQLSELVMTVVDLLLERSVPHNLIIADERTVYLILRGFASLQVRFGWLEYCGVIVNDHQSSEEAILSALQKQFQKISLEDTSSLITLIRSKLSTYKSSN